jgi:hypothetical protein
VIWFILGMIIGANFGALMMAVVQMNRPPRHSSNVSRQLPRWLRRPIVV